VHEFHAHLRVVPDATVFVPGLNASLVTEIPPAGGGVLTPPLLVGAVVLAPPPPHALSEPTASMTKTTFIVKRLLDESGF